jgi:hypothetical protein
MLSRICLSRGSPRRGYTISELLVAMALIVFIMVVLSESLSTGLEAFRKLKGIGDQQEKLRTAATLLRRDLAEAHFDTTRFVAQGLRNGKVNPEEAGGLRARYEAIAADAGALDAQFAALGARTPNPAAKRVIQRLAATLELIEFHAKNMVVLIRLVEDDDDDDCGSGGGGSPEARPAKGTG